MSLPVYFWMSLVHIMRRSWSSQATQALLALLPFLVSGLLSFLCKFPLFLELLIAFPFPVLKTLGLVFVLFFRPN